MCATIGTQLTQPFHVLLSNQNKFRIMNRLRLRKLFVNLFWSVIYLTLFSGEDRVRWLGITTKCLIKVFYENVVFDAL